MCNERRQCYIYLINIHNVQAYMQGLLENQKITFILPRVQVDFIVITVVLSHTRNVISFINVAR
jgi:hypothetical protein